MAEGYIDCTTCAGRGMVPWGLSGEAQNPRMLYEECPDCRRSKDLAELRDFLGLYDQELARPEFAKGEEQGPDGMCDKCRGYLLDFCPWCGSKSDAWVNRPTEEVAEMCRKRVPR